MRPSRVSSPHVGGGVDAGFGAVRDEFVRNFTERREIGAACAVYVGGRKVVDLWGGVRDVTSGEPWQRDTMVLVFSTTKGMAASAMAVAHSGGLFQLDDPVAKHWPEFAQNGKAEVTIRQLLSHQAGLCAPDVQLTPQLLADADVLGDLLARQKVRWDPGERHGYHYLTLGLYESQLLRRVDPGRRPLGLYFQGEVAQPLGADFYIGLPADVDPQRIARIKAFRPIQMMLHMNTMPARLVLNYLRPRSLTNQTFGNPKLKSPGDFDLPVYRSLELPAAGGIGEVRGVAAIYGDFAVGGARLGISPETMAELEAPPRTPRDGARDVVLGVETHYSFGFMKSSPDFRFGTGGRSFGTMGAGGSFGFADPDAGVGFCYAPNRMGFHLWDDPRELVLRDAVYRTIGA
ncbi:MAG: class A beta-lactamase-related serine hydrolase [Ilumatobacter sp.]|nr:MAG: class A beta-lactamase-related serine hydrolase [Ilumatobacter sp.]